MKNCRRTFRVVVETTRGEIEMVLYRTGNVPFDNAVAACEAARQVAVLSAVTQKDYDKLDLAYYQCVVAAGKANAVNTENERAAVIDLSKRNVT
jgi:hypothetical protein